MVAKSSRVEGHAGLRDRLVHAGAEDRERARVEHGRLDLRDDLVEGRVTPVLCVGWHGSSEQHREVLDARSRQGEQRLEQQMKQQVVAPDVDDEGNVGPDRGDVQKVRFGPDADVRAAFDAALLEVWNDVQIRTLVGDEIVGIEVASRLGERRDLRGEGRLRRRPRATAGQSPRQGEEQRSDPESELEPTVVQRSRSRGGLGSLLRCATPAWSYVSSSPLIGLIQMLRNRTGFP